VTGWPHLGVEAYTQAIAAANEYLPKNVAPTKRLRLDRLGEDMLLCLFEGDINTGGTNPAQLTVPWIKNAFSWDFHRPKMIKTHIKNVGGLTKKRPNFCFRYFPQISTLMEIPQGNTMENSGKQNPKMGFKSPSST
jgi:hypothetical protein